MTLYLNSQFSLPANTAKISEELWKYRTGQITKEEYVHLVGEPPPGEEGNEP